MSDKAKKIIDSGIIDSGAGFLKWIADGIIEPITGGRLKREPLILQTVEYKDIGYQGILSESYALSFSLEKAHFC